MTIRSKVKQLLMENGLFDDDAEQVTERVIADTASMQGRWNDRIEDYPQAFLAVLWMNVRRVALRWIDETCPQAWFRPLFDDGVETAATPGGQEATK